MWTYCVCLRWRQTNPSQLVSITRYISIFKHISDSDTFNATFLHIYIPTIYINTARDIHIHSQFTSRPSCFQTMRATWPIRVSYQDSHQNCDWSSIWGGFFLVYRQYCWALLWLNAHCDLRFCLHKMSSSSASRRCSSMPSRCCCCRFCRLFVFLSVLHRVKFISIRKKGVVNIKTYGVRWRWAERGWKRNFHRLPAIDNRSLCVPHGLWICVCVCVYLIGEHWMIECLTDAWNMLDMASYVWICVKLKKDINVYSKWFLMFLLISGYQKYYFYYQLI